MNEQIQFARRPGWGPKDYLNECRRLLGIEDRAACYWDTHMETSEKRVILQAANLPTETEFLRRRFKSWTPADQKRIKEAAKRASQWANTLEVAQ
jgi:hypothetical protein